MEIFGFTGKKKYSPVNFGGRSFQTERNIHALVYNYIFDH
jgi:hypothetical protein